MQYVAFLGGINVGKRRVKMPVLVDIFERLGHRQVASFIASGNLVFESGRRRLPQLERDASAALHTGHGYDVPVFIRRWNEVEKIALVDHFEGATSGGANIHVGLMQVAPDAATASSLEAVTTATDSFRVIDREFYWVCSTRMSDSKVWDLPETKRLQLPRFTLRNWSTIQRLFRQFSDA